MWYTAIMCARRKQHSQMLSSDTGLGPEELTDACTFCVMRPSVPENLVIGDMAQRCSFHLDRYRRYCPFKVLTAGYFSQGSDLRLRADLADICTYEQNVAVH